MVMEKFSINCCVGCMKLQAHIVYQWHRNTHTHTVYQCQFPGFDKVCGNGTTGGNWMKGAGDLSVPFMQLPVTL